MDNNKGPFSWLKKFTSKEEGSEKRTGKYQYMVLVLCIGAAFMVVGNVLFADKSSPTASPAIKNVSEESEEVPAFGIKKNSSNQAVSNYEEKYEKRLKDALEEMLGVNNVKVVVTIGSTEKKVLEKNRITKSQTTEEKDNEGGERRVVDASVDEQVVIIRDGEKEVPIVVETKMPEIIGVLVVAKGAENIQVKKWIVEAVTRALGVPSHRVSVAPKN